MNRVFIIRDLLEFVGLSGIVLMISLVSLTKMALGAVLTLAGAFLPSRQEDKTNGQAHISISKVTAAFKGSLRYGVIVAGVLLIVGAVIDGTHEVQSGSGRVDSAELIKGLSPDELNRLTGMLRQHTEEECRTSQALGCGAFRAFPAKIKGLGQIESPSNGGN